MGIRGGAVLGFVWAQVPAAADWLDLISQVLP